MAQDNVFKIPKRRIVGQRFPGENFQSGSRQTAAPKSRKQRPFVDEAAPRHIVEIGAGFHGREHFGAHHAAGFRVFGQNQDDVVRFRHGFLQPRQRINFGCEFMRLCGVFADADDGDAESREAFRDFRADVPKADDAGDGTGHFVVRPASFPASFRLFGVHGIVITPAITDEPVMKSFEVLKEKNIPFVFCNRGVAGVRAPRVISNNYYGAYIATKHLISLGYKRIAFIAKPVFYSVSEQRYQGYLGALHEAGLPIDSDYVFFENEIRKENAGYESGLHLLKKTPAPDAILCFNDEIAKGVYFAAEAEGRKVGVD